MCFVSERMREGRFDAPDRREATVLHMVSNIHASCRELDLSDPFFLTPLDDESVSCKKQCERVDSVPLFGIW